MKFISTLCVVFSIVVACTETPVANNTPLEFLELRWKVGNAAVFEHTSWLDDTTRTYLDTHIVSHIDEEEGTTTTNWINPSDSVYKAKEWYSDGKLMKAAQTGYRGAVGKLPTTDGEFVADNSFVVLGTKFEERVTTIKSSISIELPIETIECALFEVVTHLNDDIYGKFLYCYAPSYGTVATESFDYDHTTMTYKRTNRSVLREFK